MINGLKKRVLCVFLTLALVLGYVPVNARAEEIGTPEDVVVQDIEPVTEPVTEPATEPATEPVTEPAVDTLSSGRYSGVAVYHEKSS